MKTNSRHSHRQAPAFHGFSHKGKVTYEASTQTDTQYTAQLVTVEPGRRAALGEKYWHFHNGPTIRGRGDKNEDEDRVNAKHKSRKTEEMLPPNDLQGMDAIRRSREAWLAPPLTTEERKRAEAERLLTFQQRVASAKAARDAARDAEEDVDPSPEMTMDVINQRVNVVMARHVRRGFGRGLDDNEGTSGAVKTKDTNKVWEWLRPFDPSESTTEAATGSGASVNE
jgi:hypothetical protein